MQKQAKKRKNTEREIIRNTTTVKKLPTKMFMLQIILYLNEKLLNFLLLLVDVGGFVVCFVLCCVRISFYVQLYMKKIYITHLLYYLYSREHIYAIYLHFFFMCT